MLAPGPNVMQPVDRIKGVSVFLLKSYYLSDTTKLLTVYGVTETNGKIGVPLETREKLWPHGPPSETVYECAARSLDEELHFAGITPEMFADASLFDRFDANGIALFVSRFTTLPGVPDTKLFTGSLFHQRRAEVRAVFLLLLLLVIVAVVIIGCFLFCFVSALSPPHTFFSALISSNYFPLISFLF